MSVRVQLHLPGRITAVLAPALAANQLISVGSGAVCLGLFFDTSYTFGCEVFRGHTDWAYRKSFRSFIIRINALVVVVVVVEAQS